MSRIIQTEFDDPIAEDVALEEAKEIDYKDIMANAENILKAFLYLKRLFSSAPVFNAIVAIGLYEGDHQQITINPEANIVTIKNIDNTQGNVVYNNMDPLILMPYEQIDIPLRRGDTLETSGKFNVIQIKYEVR